MFRYLVEALGVTNVRTSLRAVTAREALRFGLLAVGAVHLRYKHSPLDGVGAKRLYEDFKGKILRKLETFVSQNPGVRTLAAEDEVMLAALILLITAGVSVVTSDISQANGRYCHLPWTGGISWTTLCATFRPLEVSPHCSQERLEIDSP